MRYLSIRNENRKVTVGVDVRNRLWKMEEKRYW